MVAAGGGVEHQLGAVGDLGAAVLGGGENDAVGAVVLAVGEQDGEFGFAEHVTGAPLIQAELVFPGGEAGGGGTGADADAGVGDARS